MGKVGSHLCRINWLAEMVHFTRLSVCDGKWYRRDAVAIPRELFELVLKLESGAFLLRLIARK